MIIDTLSLGQLATNCYLIYDNKSKDAIILDPAEAAEFIAEKVIRLGLNVKAIIATQGHFDHNLAAGQLQLILTSQPVKSPTKNDIPYYIHQADLFLLKTINQSASYWLKQNINYPLPQNIQYLKSELLQIPSASWRIKIQILHTPGHTPGSICLYVENEAGGATLFSGDTIFKNNIGRHDFSYSDKQALYDSLARILKLPKDTVIYPGHGEPTTVKQEKLANK